MDFMIFKPGAGFVPGLGLFFLIDFLYNSLFNSWVLSLSLLISMYVWLQSFVLLNKHETAPRLRKWWNPYIWIGNIKEINEKHTPSPAPGLENHEMCIFCMQLLKKSMKKTLPAQIRMIDGPLHRN